VTAPDGVWLARPDPIEAGTPVAIKDLLDTAGLVTTYGSVIFADHVPARTAESVLRLEAAGYAVAGKTNLHEFAYGVSSQNDHFGTVPNPRFPGRLAGGSSGGTAAAIAAGDVEVGLGTDSGGSIRIPAAWCGIAGFKPTFGLVPTDGCFPLAPSYDHVGPLASTVEGCVELMQALAPGFEEPKADLAGLQVGVGWLAEAEPAVAALVAAAAGRFPRRRAIELPIPDRAENALFMREVADVHRGLFPERADEYGETIRWKLELCNEVTDAEVERARAIRDDYRRSCEQLFGDLDLIVTPTVAITPPPADGDERKLRGRVTRLTYPFDLLGWPALALPAGLTPDGLPASIQLVGQPGDDARVLAAGAALASLV
jgi:aspartyl-tRNA(Asn)/glutamyl-tRNA(Gln) amidotransferase subunit A